MLPLLFVCADQPYKRAVGSRGALVSRVVKCALLQQQQSTEPVCIRLVVPNLCLTMYPFSISTDEHVPLKFRWQKILP